MTENIYKFLHQDVFNYPIIKTSCRADRYNSASISKGLDTIFNSDRVRKFKTSITTCTIPTALTDIQEIEGIQDLLSWITESILEVAVHFKKPNAASVKFTEAWTNRMFENCSNGCHLHRPGIDGVAIFYYEVPLDGASDLVLVKNGKNETDLNTYPKEDQFNIKVNTRDLIIHHRNIPHAMNRHRSKDPRTCLVFNFVLE